MENKKRSFPKIIIIIVVLLLVGVGGVYIGTKLVKGDLYITKINATSEEKQSTSGSLEVDSKLAQYLYSIVSDVGSYTMKPWMYPDKDKILTSELTEEQKMAIVFQNLPMGRFSSKYSEISGLNKTIEGTQVSSYVPAYNEVDGFVDKDIVESTYERIFGEKSLYTPDTAMYTRNYWGVYVYGKDTTHNQEGYFKYKCDGCGGTGSYIVYRTLTKAEYYNGDVRLYETSTATDADGNNLEEKVIYTFKKDKEDGMYHYYSREVQ